MPVMVQVFRLEPNWVLLYLFEYICFQLQFAFGFVYCIGCEKKFLFLVVKKWEVLVFADTGTDLRSQKCCVFGPCLFFDFQCYVVVICFE
jgi:hypothetical protein